MNGLDQFGGRGHAFGLDIDDLAADHTGRKSGVEIAEAADAGAHRNRDLAQDLHYGIGGRRNLCDGLEGERLQRVAGQDGDGFAEGDVAGWLAAAQVVVVQRGQIVVDQRVGVQHLDGGAEVLDALGQFAGAGDHPRGLHAQDGLQALAAGEDAVAHGTVDGVGQRLGRGQESFECSVREAGAGGQQGSYRGIHLPDDK